MPYPGNKNGNRRTANIRSVGYADLFVLSKEDLWVALQEYPEARQALLEKGRQLLRKDNLLDEDIARQQDLERLSADEKLIRFERALEELTERLALMTEHFNHVQRQLKQRITRAERELKQVEDEDEAEIAGKAQQQQQQRLLLTVPGQSASIY